MNNLARVSNTQEKLVEAVASETPLSLEELVAQIQTSELYADVSIKEEVAETILEAMELKNVTRAELAELLQTSRAYITKVLGGDENLTLETLNKIFRAVNCRLHITYSSISDGEMLWTPPKKSNKISLKCLAGGAPLDWKPVSTANLSKVCE